MNDNTGYVCLGTCQAEITDEQYNEGLTTCGAEVCTMKGKPFAKGLKCQTCGKNIAEGTQHEHSEDQGN